MLERTAGLSANYSGSGFADMRFNVDAVPAENFAQWVDATRGAGPVLDAQAYADLAKPSKAVAPFTYRAVAPGLFDGIVSSVMQPADESTLDHPSTSQRGRTDESPWQAQLERNPVRSADRDVRDRLDGREQS